MSLQRSAGRWLSRLVGVGMLVGSLCVLWLMHGQLEQFARKGAATRSASSHSSSFSRFPGSRGARIPLEPEADSPW